MFKALLVMSVFFMWGALILWAVIVGPPISQFIGCGVLAFLYMLMVGEIVGA